jgi:hypothetical protein
MHRYVAVSLFALAACTTGRATYTGALVADTGTCPSGGNATLSLGARHFVFAPTGGVLTIEGAHDSTPNLHGETEVTSTDHRPYRLTVEAVRQEDVVTGTYADPHCRAHFRLVRTED